MSKNKDNFEATQLECDCLEGLDIPGVNVVFDGNVESVNITVNHFHEEKTKED